jgi:hypothetical protein
MNTTWNDFPMPAEIFDINRTPFVNPLAGKFALDGYLLTVRNFSLPGGTLAAALPLMNHRTTADENTNRYGLPYLGAFAFNSNLVASSAARVTAFNLRETYYTALHEIGHTLGLGTEWYRPWFSSGTDVVVRRNFVVSAGDNCSNPQWGTKGNIFYATQRGATSVYKAGEYNASNVNQPFTRNGNDKTLAWNPFLSTAMDASSAVAFYNQAFGTSLSAIPLESGMGAGSYAGHWAEGFDGISYPSTVASSLANSPGLDARQYYGVTDPGAPAMQDELMTPIAEGTIDTPLSKITVGALRDLGWQVRIDAADNYEPLKHVLTIANGQIRVKKHNFGPDILGSLSRAFFHLRRGVTYNFVNQTSLPLVFTVVKKDTLGNNTLTNIAAPGVSQVGNNYLLTLPRSFTDVGIIIKTTSQTTPNVWWIVS